MICASRGVSLSAALLVTGPQYAFEEAVTKGAGGACEGRKGWIHEYKECKDMEKCDDEWTALRAALPPHLLLLSVLVESGKTLNGVTDTHPHIHTRRSQETAAREERRDAAVPSQAEVTESRKPIKKMINIHVGKAESTSRYNRLCGASHAHICI